MLICIPMMKNMHKGNASSDDSASNEIAELREEIARLKAERALENSETING